MASGQWGAMPGGTWVPRPRHAGTSSGPGFPGPDAYPGPLPSPPPLPPPTLPPPVFGDGGGNSFFYISFLAFMVNTL